MPSVGRVGLDSAGGVVLAGSFSVLVNDMPVVRQGSPISDHGTSSKHDAAVMATGLPSVLVEDIAICRTFDTSSCGHMLFSFSDVEAG